ncbi:unnamed protein product [Chrysoparadoxa australica]
MDLLGGYGSEGSEDGAAPKPKHSSKMTVKPVNARPDVVVVRPIVQTSIDPMQVGAYRKPGAIEQGQLMLHNPTAASLRAPLQGPAHPYQKKQYVPAGATKSISGVIEKASIEDWSFQEQYHTYHQYGYAIDVNGQQIGDEKARQSRGDNSVYTTGAADLKREKKRKKVESEKDGTAVRLGAGDVDTDGVWAPMPESKDRATDFEKGTMNEEQAAFRAAWEAEQSTKTDKAMTEEERIDRRDERKIGHLLPARHDRDTAALKESSQFHGKEETDYQGRSWVQPPSGLREGDGSQAAFAPKKCIHRWMGHSKGVSSIEFFPGYGHLMLSGSMDGTVRVWDVLSHRRVLRTYKGHSAAVRDVKFNNDGSKFTSCGYDRFVRLWDTETGQCITTLTNRRMPYMSRFYPKDNNTILAGCSDNKIIQWDVNTGDITQEYNHHLQPVNSVLFVDDDQRIVSTSDDKKVLIWEYNIPVPIKYISDPSMHSIPATALHPSGASWVGQSLNNEIVVYGARDKFKMNRKKVFKGHLNAGYACRMDFSPNGKFLASGDGQGRLFVWDWGSAKVYKKLNAHKNGPCIDVKWHPIESSWVATAGWDGEIALWS